MKYVNYPFEDIKRLSFYLATEEYLALNFPKDEYFFMWQVKPSVIFGRNQLIENEVNLPYVRENNIMMYRRKSGGGCVYSDFSNIMFSFITPNFNKDFVFDNYLGKVVTVLKSLGLNAEFSGRNDILIDGMKVSGNAFYKVKDRSIVHGTMLFATDFSVMAQAITPVTAKLESKGIDSVRKRVTNLSDHLTIDIETFKAYMKQHLVDEQITLSTEDIIKIEEIEKEYLTEEFVFGKNPGYSVVKQGYVKAGYLEFRIELKNNKVKKINLMGDYFLLGDQDYLLRKFHHVQFNKEAFSKVLSTIKLSDFIMSLTEEDFLKILF